MTQWAVFMCPYDLTIHRVEEWSRCIWNSAAEAAALDTIWVKPMQVTVSGAYHIVVEADTEVEAKLLALQEAVVKRIADLKDSYNRIEKEAKVFAEQSNDYQKCLMESERTFSKIISEGELTIFSTGKRIIFEAYRSGHRVTGEIGSTAKLPLVLKTIEEASPTYDDDCY